MAASEGSDRSALLASRAARRRGIAVCGGGRSAVSMGPGGQQRRRRPSTSTRKAVAAASWTLLVLGRRVGAGWIDPDTPEAAKTIRSLHDGAEYELIMSDEFEVSGRSFDDGHDPMWTSTTHSDDAQTSNGLGSQQFYNSSYGTTTKGSMNITTTDESTTWRGYNPYKRKYETLSKSYRSSMVNTWNKFCFTGGIIEIDAKLPGEHNIGGLWPAFWLLGNLGRATYEASTNLIWPWSYDKCDPKLQRAQEISACNKINHFGLHGYQGRGSTEIDILEAQPGTSDDPLMNLGKVNSPYLSTTLQLAPGIPVHRPTNGELLSPENTWYEGMQFAENSSLNYHFYGMHVDKTTPQEPVYRGADQAYIADAISGLTSLTRTHFHEYHNYKLEWVPPPPTRGDAGPRGHLKWYIDDEMVLGIDAETVEKHGTQIPNEPSYVILNTAVSSSWGFPDPCPSGCDCACYDCKDPACHCAIPSGFCNMLPSYFMIDHVRVYQNKNDSSMSIGCDIPSHPSKLFIEAHRYRYMRSGDKKPLKDLMVGGGKCNDETGCHRGKCHWGKCKCEEGWVGPLCQSTHKFDDISYEEHVDLSPRPIAVPVVLQAIGGVIVLLVLGMSFVLGRQLSKTKGQYREDLLRNASPLAGMMR
ncbi:unnamed protein product [Ectocarpus sp. CCAP 1310/34]|nr:unnamed protein product [Ectocarpus sp. CCAP 1310/34]